MVEMYGSKFKFIYTDWFIKNGERQPFGNGIHPIITEFIQYIHKNNLNVDYYKILQYDSKEKGIKFDHSELINYLYRNFQKVSGLVHLLTVDKGTVEARVKTTFEKVWTVELEPSASGTLRYYDIIVFL